MTTDNERFQERTDSFRKTKGPITRDDIIFMLDTMAAVKSSADSLIQAVTDGMKKIVAAAGEAANISPAAGAPADDTGPAAGADDSKEYVCFNCGNIHDKPVDFCAACHTGLKWK